MSSQPPPSTDTDASPLHRESPFVVLTIVGTFYFVGYAFSAIRMITTPNGGHPSLEQILNEGYMAHRILTLVSISIRVLPALAGVPLLLYLAAKRRSPLPVLTPRPAPWRVWDFFKIWASSFCFLPIARLIMDATPSFWKRLSEPATFGVLASGQNVVIVLLCVYAARLRTGTSFFLSARPARSIRRAFAYGLKALLITAPFVFGADFLSGKALDLLKVDKPLNPAISLFFQAPLSHVWILLLAVVVMAPLGEELLFRGFLYPSLEGRLGKMGGIIVTGVIFAVVHLNPYDLLPLLVLGIGLTYTYSRTRSLGACMVFHGLHNALTAMSVLALRLLLR